MNSSLKPFVLFVAVVLCFSALGVVVDSLTGTTYASPVLKMVVHLFYILNGMALFYAATQMRAATRKAVDKRTLRYSTDDERPLFDHAERKA